MKKRRKLNPLDSYFEDYDKDKILKFFYSSSYKNTEIKKYYITNIENLIENSNNIEFLGGGSYGIVYKFDLTKNFMINNVILKKKTYVIKLYSNPISNTCFNNLILYSKFGIIPKIYVHNKYYTIMNFVSGITMERIIELYDQRKINYKTLDDIYKKYYKLLEIFFNLFPDDRGTIDISRSNTIVSNDYKSVYLIDPCY